MILRSHSSFFILHSSFFIFSSSAVLHKLLHSLIEIGGSEELLYGEMHAVAPVMAWVGWDIDALGIGIGKAQVFVN